MTADRKAENGLRLFLEELGSSKSVETFLRNHGNVRTRRAYAGELCMYFRWLRGKGIAMTPDELIQDNLRSVFESRPTDVVTKRKHTDPLGDYINAYLIVQRGDSEAKRSLAAAAIRGFYSSTVRMPVDLVSVDLAVLPLDLHDIGGPAGLPTLRADCDLRAHA
ncbi:MAG: hypothetical protein ABSB26_00545 [Nitrososphaerales archaeon]|jgi:hypothetical protein